jgi:hypothetical protein
MPNGFFVAKWWGCEPFRYVLVLETACNGLGLRGRFPSVRKSNQGGSGRCERECLLTGDQDGTYRFENDQEVEQDRHVLEVEQVISSFTQASSIVAP